MSIASLIFEKARNNSQYDAYSFPNAAARLKLLLFALFADPLKMFKLFPRDVAALPDDAPVFAKLASASVIRMMFALTLGAFESVSNRYLRLSASKGMLFTALPLATLPNLDMDVTRLLMFVISNFSSPILFIWRTKFCNCADICGKLAVACVEFANPSLLMLVIRFDKPVVSKLSAPTLFIPLTK